MRKKLLVFAACGMGLFANDIVIKKSNYGIQNLQKTITEITDVLNKITNKAIQ